MDNNVTEEEKHQGKPRISPSFVIFMTTLIDMIGFGMVIPLLPFHPETAGAGALALGLLVGSFSLMQFIFAPLLGRLSDKVGRRPVILLSIFCSAISFVVFALADSFPLLLISRITAGMATEAAVAQAYIADITSEKERTAGLGKVGAAHGAGFILGPALSGFLSVYGFSAPGFGAAALTAVNFVFAFLFLPETSVHTQSKVNKAVASDGYWGRLAKALAEPLIGIVLVILFITTFAFSAIPVIVPLLGIEFFGFGEVEMSYFFMYIGVVQIVLQGVVIGRLTRWLGEKNLIVLGTLLMTLGVFLGPLIPNLATVLLAFTVMSSGVGILGTVLPSFISKRAPPGEQGGMLGVVQAVGSIARIPGPLFGGLIADYAGLNVAFLVTTAIVFVAFVLGLTVFRNHKAHREYEETVSVQPIEW